jgi:hypothetical protein
MGIRLPPRGSEDALVLGRMMVLGLAGQFLEI